MNMCKSSQFGRQLQNMIIQVRSMDVLINIIKFMISIFVIRYCVNVIIVESKHLVMHKQVLTTTPVDLENLFS